MNRTHQELLRTTLGNISPAGTAADDAIASRTDGAAAPVPISIATRPGKPEDTERKAVAAEPRSETMPGTPVAWKPSMDDLPSLQPRTAAAEQFRRLRSRLLEYRAQQPMQALLMSSALPQEGKSFVAVNLAVGLNQHRGTRVLLVDGDMRRYSVQRYFGTVHKPGLADFLAGTHSAQEVMQCADAKTVAQYPGLAHLSIIPGGGMQEHVADLSEDSHFGSLIEFARPHFDWIVVDSSPVTLVSDAVNLARHCDGVLLVVRSGVTKYQQAQQAQAELQAANLIGVVLNAVEDRPAPSYYGYGPAGADA